MYSNFYYRFILIFYNIMYSYYNICTYRYKKIPCYSTPMKFLKNKYYSMNKNKNMCQILSPRQGSNIVLSYKCMHIQYVHSLYVIGILSTNSVCTYILKMLHCKKAMSEFVKFRFWIRYCRTK
jgi:hypothetical protein